jgi:hypothetical protein
MQVKSYHTSTEVIVESHKQQLEKYSVTLEEGRLGTLNGSSIIESCLLPTLIWETTRYFQTLATPEFQRAG